MIGALCTCNPGRLSNGWGFRPQQWFLDEAIEGDQLLAEESILGDEFALAAGDIERCGEKDTMARGPGEGKVGLFQRGQYGAKGSDKPVN